MSNNVIIASAHAKGSRIEHLTAEPLIMDSRPTLDPYIDTSDPIVADKRRGLVYGMETEGYPLVGGNIHLQWYEDKKCYPCRVVYCHTGKYYITFIYGKPEQYAVELVSTRNRAWHYIVDAHKSKQGEDPYDPTTYIGRILFFKDIPLGLGSDPTTPITYVCEYLVPNNDIFLHRKGPCSQNTTIWLYKVMFYRTSGYE